MIKKILFWSFITIVVTLLVLSYIGYRSFNTEAFKNQVIKTAQDLTGREFTINGTAELKWRPLPTMTITDVSLSNIPNSPNSHMFTAEKILIQIEWASLLKHPTRIKSIQITKPRFLIERQSRSVTNMNFPVLFAANITTDQDAFLGSQSGPRIDNLSIEDGTIQYINQISKLDVLISGITGTVDFGSVNGPFTFHGEGVFQEIPLSIDFSLGAHEVSRPIDFVTQIIEKKSGTTVNANGQILTEDPEKLFIANVSLNSDKPNLLLEKFSAPSLPKEQNKPVIGSFVLNANAGTTVVSDCIFKLGQNDDDMTVTVDWTFDNSARIQQIKSSVSAIDLDMWSPTFVEWYENKNFGNFVPTNLDLTVNSLLWKGKSATQIHLAGQYEDHSLKVEEVAAQLPGTTTLNGSALVSTDFHNFTGMAEINLKSQNIRDVIQFFDIKSVPLPKDPAIFHGTEFLADLEWNPEKTVIAIPSFSLDGFNGSVQLDYAPTSNNILQLSLKNTNLNLYYPPTSTEVTPIATAIHNLFNTLATIQLPQTPSTLQLDLSNVTFRDVVLKNLKAEIETSSSTLNIQADAETNQQEKLLYKVKLDNVGTKDWNIVENMWDIEGQNPQQLLVRLGLNPNHKILLNSKTFHSTGSLTGSKQNWQVDASYESQVLKMGAQGSLVNNKPQNLHIAIEHDSLPHFIAQFTPDNPFPKLTGDFAFDGILSQTGDTYACREVFIQADNQTLLGSFSYVPDANVLDVKLMGQTVDADKFLPDTSTFYLPGSGFNSNAFSFNFLKSIQGSLQFVADTLVYHSSTLKRAELSARILDNTLTVDNFKAFGDGNDPASFQVKGSLNWSAMPTLNLQIFSQHVKLGSSFGLFNGVGFSGGELTTQWNLSASGEAPIQMVRTLSGNGTVSLQSPTWIGTDLPSALAMINQSHNRNEPRQSFEPKLKHAFSTGDTAVDEIHGDFTIKEGVWQMAGIEMLLSDATAKGFTIDWDVPTNELKAKLALTLDSYPTLPSIVYTLTNAQRGVSYEVDIAPFAQGLADEFEHERKQKEEAAALAKRQEEEKTLSDAKRQGQQAFQNLLAQLQELEGPMMETSDIMAQNEFETAQTIAQNIQEIFDKDGDDPSQYLAIVQQVNLGLQNIQNAKDLILKQQADLFKQRSATFMAPANQFILKMNEMYQKRPTNNMLANLLQNSQDQYAIMQRAQEQFKKPLSSEQIVKVAQIIEEAYKKIERAHEYAADIYAGRQSIDSSNAIQRVN